MSKSADAAYNPQGITKNVVLRNCTWIRKSDGVCLHRPSGFYYWRPWRFHDGKMSRTWKSLDTTNLPIPKERYAKLRYPAEGHAPVPNNGAQETLAGKMGVVIRRYLQDGCPDKHEANRAGQTLDDETAHCATLLEFWDAFSVSAGAQLRAFPSPFVILSGKNYMGMVYNMVNSDPKLADFEGCALLR